MAYLRFSQARLEPRSTEHQTHVQSPSCYKPHLKRQVLTHQVIVTAIDALRHRG